MSQENVEIVRRAMDAFNARDRERLLSLMDPEIEYRSATEQKTYRGIAGVVQYRADVDAVMEDFHTDEDRFLEVGKDRVLHLYRILGRGAGSGVPVSRRNAILWQLRNGKLLEGQVYLDQREAFEAACLSEQDSPRLLRRRGVEPPSPGTLQ
jgi:ketosteroid isomerase-like protein